MCVLGAQKPIHFPETLETKMFIYGLSLSGNVPKTANCMTCMGLGCISVFYSTPFDSISFHICLWWQETCCTTHLVSVFPGLGE